MWRQFVVGFVILLISPLDDCELIMYRMLQQKEVGISQKFCAPKFLLQ